MTLKTCGTCAHATPADAKWLRYGGDYSTVVHCRRFDVPTATLIPKRLPCTFIPPRWEPKT